MALFLSQMLDAKVHHWQENEVVVLRQRLAEGEATPEAVAEEVDQAVLLGLKRLVKRCQT